MANDANILMRMRAAQIPPHAYEKSMLTLDQRKFQGIISNKKYEHSGFLMSYIVRPSTRESGSHTVSTVCAVAAKELVLQKKKVRYLDVPRLIKESKTDGGEFELGHGFWVIGDLGENTQHWPRNEWDTAQSYLLSHLARGGGLILGDNGASDLGMWGEEMLDSISIFDLVRVE